ncbi:hypothetical protein [Candidatus Rhodoluna planktonica]|uniref:hypothetical protein n=1 Tax=Candidatus Rhodoluna planktonica TaxID=535712 RepID=UPI0011AB3027|nr:hypothetical protein [Candidatus Rhodoluna planktonica]
MLRQWGLVLRKFILSVAALLSMGVVSGVVVGCFLWVRSNPQFFLATTPSPAISDPNKIDPDKSINWDYSPRVITVAEGMWQIDDFVVGWADSKIQQDKPCQIFNDCLFVEIREIGFCPMNVIVSYSMWPEVGPEIGNDVLVLAPNEAVGIHEIGTNSEKQFSNFSFDGIRCDLPVLEEPGEI